MGSEDEKEGCGEPQLLKGLTFTVASPALRSEILEFRRTIYAADLGHDGLDGYDNKALHLVAHNAAGEVVATLRMLHGSQRPFEMERFLVLADYIGAAAKVSEVGRFCVRPDYRNVGRQPFVHLGMVKLTHECARLHGVTDLVLLSLPHLLNLYKTTYFTPLNADFDHPTWGRVHPMHLNLPNFRSTHHNSRRRLARLLLGPPPRNIIT